jgi:hypothetical protein
MVSHFQKALNQVTTTGVPVRRRAFGGIRGKFLRQQQLRLRTRGVVSSALQTLNQRSRAIARRRPQQQIVAVPMMAPAGRFHVVVDKPSSICRWSTPLVEGLLCKIDCVLLSL